MKLFGTLGALCSLLLPPAASAQADLLGRIGKHLASIEPDLIEFRRDIHRHPEVSGQEERTAGLVAKRLSALGLEVRTGVGGHGVVGVLRGGKPGPVIGYRADMDAVYSNDPDPVDFRSLVPGVRHICGHDVHTTVGIALATALARVRTELAGTVLFVFQPAEERATGAEAMLASGVFQNPVPVAIYGVHTAPFPVGQLATVAGDMMSGRDQYRIEIAGSGNLTAATDSIRRQLEAIGNVPVADILKPGTQDLILVQPAPPADSAGVRILRGQIMATTVSRPRVVAGIERLRQIRLPGINMAVTYRPRAIAGVTNDATLTSRAIAAVNATLGAGSAVPVTALVPAFSEDFGSFQAKVPGTFFFLGVSNPAKGTVGMPHSPGYVADEGAIVVGARAMAGVLIDRLTTR